jgi:hypothetical protein
MKLNWHSLSEVVAYSKKLGGCMVVLDAENTRGNYGIVPITRPDIFIKENIAIVYVPENHLETYLAFDYTKTPRLLSFVEAGLAKLKSFKSA